jgi:hypothetical protein
MNKKIAIVSFLTLILSFSATTSYAEEVVSTPSETPAEESYVPPAEANEGVGVGQLLIQILVQFME